MKDCNKRLVIKSTYLNFQLFQIAKQDLSSKYLKAIESYQDEINLKEATSNLLHRIVF